MRMDGRLEWADLLMRMEYPGSSAADENKFRNRLQQRMARMRERFLMVSWRDTAGDNNAIRDRVLGSLTPAQLAARGGLGSTRGSTPGSLDSQGRVIPVPGRRARGTANTRNTAARVQQPQASGSQAGPSHQPPQHQQMTSKGFSANDVRQNQTAASQETSRNIKQDSPVIPMITNGQKHRPFASHRALPEDRHGEDIDAEMDKAQKSMTTSHGERRVLDQYLEQDRVRRQMCVDGLISVDELMSGMERNQAELRSSIKRVRGEIGEDDDVVEAENQRAKRLKRGGDATGSSSRPPPKTQGPTHGGFDNPQPGPSGEHNRQGALTHISHRPASRPVGSAVERLHNDRSRRPAPKATQNQSSEVLYYPQPNVVMTDTQYPIYDVDTEPQQPQDFPDQADLYQGSSYDRVGPTQSRLGSYQLQPGNSIGTTNLQSGRQNLACNENAHIAPQRPYRRRTASTSRDDPFLSDELLDGMLNGHPHANYVGSIYTRSLQKEIDEYYQRVMAPPPRVEPESDAPEDVVQPPPPFWILEEPSVFVADLLDPDSRPPTEQGGGTQQISMLDNVPGASAQVDSAPTFDQLVAEWLPPEEDWESNLVVGDITLWNPEWSKFVGDHDAEPLLRGDYPDEYPPSPS